MNDRNTAKSSEYDQGETFSNWLRTWRYFFLALGLGIAVLLFYGEENWRGKRAWENHKRQLEAQGEPMEPSAFVPPRVAEVENFAATPCLAPLFHLNPGTQGTALGEVEHLYNAASSALQLPKKDSRSKLSSAVGPSNSWVKASANLKLWYAAFQEVTNSPVYRGKGMSNTNCTLQEAAAGVLAGLSDCDPVIEELRVASRRPYSRFDVRYDQELPAAILLPHLSALKSVSKVLQLRASAELALGRAEDAAADVELMLRLADAARAEPIIISQLVRFAQLSLAMQPIKEGLAAHQWSDPQLRCFEKGLRHFDFCADAQRALRAERGFFAPGNIQYACHHRVSVGDLMRMDSFCGNDNFNLGALIMYAAPNGWFYLEEVNQSRMSQKWLLSVIDVPGHRISPAASLVATSRIHAELDHSSAVLLLQHKLFAAVLVPSCSGFAEKTAHTQAAADTAAIACALERYRLAHGQYPESLDALLPQFINPLPHDIINGQPLKYHRTQDGQLVLYSVGWNEKDDGGVVALTASGENADLHNGDWVWRN